MVDLYKTRSFAGRADDLRISDAELCEIAKLHRNKLNSGDRRGSIGKSIYKLRIGVNGGKSDGARSVVASVVGNDVFFIYCYPKSEVSANAAKELKDSTVTSLENEACKLLALTVEQKAIANAAGVIIRVECNGLC